MNHEVVYIMRERGFQPSQAFHANYIEFHKTYADGNRTVRVALQLDKPTLANPTPGLRLSRMVVLEQFTVPLDSTDFVPEVAREDVVAISHAFRSPIQDSIITRECTRCEARVAEFYVQDSETVCRSCYAQR